MSKRLFINAIVSAIVCFTLPMASFAWWKEPHQTIAKIAYRQLTPPAKEKVDQLVNAFQQHHGQNNDYYFMAIWPDVLSIQGVKTFWRWHGVIQDYHSIEHKVKLPFSDHYNALFALKEAEEILKSQAPDYEKARFLSFMIHIVGDLHQPLHTINWIDDNHPKGDEAGHFFKVDYISPHGQKITNLHALWDSSLGTMDQYQFATERLSENADRLETIYKQSDLAEAIADLNPTHWINESFRIAKESAYAITEGANPSDSYLKENRPLAEKQIALAGYRLARLLNKIFAS